MQLNGKTLDNRGRDLGRGSSGGEDHLLLVGIPLAPVGGLRGLWRRLDWFCAEGGWHRSLELSRRSRGSAASISMGRATRRPRPAWLCVRDHLPADRSQWLRSAAAQWSPLRPGPGQPSRLLDERVQLFGGDAAVARVELNPGGRRGLIGRSRCPTRRCTEAREHLRGTQRLTGDPGAGVFSPCRSGLRR